MIVSDKICAYCGQKTEWSDHAEHIIPESLGGTEVLPIGSVCTTCNHDLGTSVDSKIFFEPMIAVGLVAAQIPGKRGIRASMRSKKGVVERQGNGAVSVKGGVVGSPNEFVVSRGFAKIAANCVIARYGSVTSRLQFLDLLRYVVSPKNSRDIWPFFALYTARPVNASALLLGRPMLPNTPEHDSEFAVVSLASGLFALPTNRDNLAGFGDLVTFIRQERKKEIASGFPQSFSVEYLSSNVRQHV